MNYLEAIVELIASWFYKPRRRTGAAQSAHVRAFLARKHPELLPHYNGQGFDKPLPELR